MCCAGRSAPSQCGVVTGSGFSSPNQPDQVRTTAYHDGSGPDSRSDAHSAIIVGGWEKQSGESRVNGVDFAGVIIGAGAANQSCNECPARPTATINSSVKA